MTDRNSMIVRRAAAGESFKTIAADVGLSHGYVSQICKAVIGKRYGGEGRYTPICPNLLRKLHAEGLTDQAIARVIGCTLTGARRARERLNLRRHPAPMGPPPRRFRRVDERRAAP